MSPNGHLMREPGQPTASCHPKTTHLCKVPGRCAPSAQSGRCPAARAHGSCHLHRSHHAGLKDKEARAQAEQEVLGDALLALEAPLQRLPAPLGCIGLLIRGLMGAKLPTVKLVTSRGCGRERKRCWRAAATKAQGHGPLQQPSLTPGAPPPWNHQPGQGVGSCRQTCHHSPPASCSAGRRSPGRGA